MLACLTRKALANPFRRVAIPDDLDSITSIDDKAEIPAEESGLQPDAAEAIWDATLGLYRTGVHPLISICLRHRGNILLNRIVGYQKGDAADPKAVVAKLNTPICQFSAAKGVSAMLLHLLAEQGEIHLLDPISYYIPAYGSNGKHNTTIFQLLAHRAGVPGVGERVDPRELFDREAIVERICAAKPLDYHGRTQAYHAITGGFIIDELIRVTTGLTAQQYMDRHFRKPLKMRYFRYGLTRRDLPRVAMNYATGLKPGPIVGGTLEKVLGVGVDEAVDLSNTEEFLTAELLAANIYSTAEEAGRFYQMMLDGGVYENRRVMQPLTIHRATQEAGKSQMDASLKMPMRYSAGFMLGNSPFGLYGPNTQHAYGHLGLSNVLCWADPSREIAVSILTTGKPVVSPHLVEMFKMLFAISRHCPITRNMRQPNENWLAA
ncbi:serine hydrolase domain-containing protein [Mangrovimicrobium sediminis]|nr:serine hydrolase domain-containing protein [Haliea sp. SAOS-164]